MPKVGIVMGSDSDLPAMKKAFEILDRMYFLSGQKLRKEKGLK